LAGDVFGSVLERINDWAEKYVPKQRDLAKAKLIAGAKVQTRA
jgi:hypothetical protein